MNFNQIKINNYIFFILSVQIAMKALYCLLCLCMDVLFPKGISVLDWEWLILMKLT